MSDKVLAWLSVCSEVQMICIWSNWCNCHPIISFFIKIQIDLTFLVPTYTGCPGKEAITVVSYAKTAELIEISFRLRAWLGSRNHVLDGGVYILLCKRAVFRGQDMPEHAQARWHCAVSWAKQWTDRDAIWVVDSDFFAYIAWIIVLVIVIEVDLQRWWYHGSVFSGLTGFIQTSECGLTVDPVYILLVY